VSQEVVHLPFGLVALDTVSLLNLADELFGPTLNLVEVVIGELSPLFANATLDLRPLAFQCVFVHYGPPISDTHWLRRETEASRMPTETAESLGCVSSTPTYSRMPIATCA
jgi:hypothetical protein